MRGVFARDVTTAISMSLNKETALQLITHIYPRVDVSYSYAFSLYFFLVKKIKTKQTRAMYFFLTSKQQNIQRPT